MNTRLIKTTKHVTEMLESIPETRSSDAVLYTEICRKLNPAALNEPFGAMITRLADKGLPPFESVRRARQKVQAKREDLRAADEVELFRAENEEEYCEYAVS